MPQLFTSPRFVALSSANQLLPGAKLLFYATGTSTPQNVYQDEALTVPHANPVVADGAGVFAPIYLDPSLPHYRVILTDASDVTQPGYPIDNVPSNQNTGQTFRLKSAAPELIFEETDASENNQKWAIRVNSEQLAFVLLDDAEGTESLIFTMDRDGTNAEQFNFSGNFLFIEGNRAERCPASNSFTATLTGCTTTPTAQFVGQHLTQSGIVKLFAAAQLQGTSNSTAMTITGVPSALRPSGTRRAFCVVRDNGGIKGAMATIDTSGTITFGLGIDGATAFTNSGTKGVDLGFELIYAKGA